MSAKDRGPGVKVPPPLIYLSFMVLGYVVSMIVPLGFSLYGLNKVLAYSLFVVGGAIAAVAVFHFWRAKTHIEPWQPASYLITSGIFSYSRNPIYVAFIIVTLGCGALLGSLWVLFSVIPSTLCLYHWVIKKEECYLEQKFGERYLIYKNKVRCWL